MNTDYPAPHAAKNTSAHPYALCESTAELFGVLSAPLRLRIIKSLCRSEKNVGELMHEVKTTQPNMSSHLNTLYKAGVLGKRRNGSHVYYHVVDPNALIDLLSMSRAMLGKQA
jgi:ArsR family transcriptional regulator